MRTSVSTAPCGGKMLGTRPRGGRSTSEYDRGSEVGGRGSGLGSERGLGEAINNASSYTPVSSICRSGIERTSKSNRSRTSDLSDGVRGLEKTCIEAKGSVASKRGA